MPNHTQKLSAAQAPPTGGGDGEDRRLGLVGDVLSSLWRRLCGTHGEQEQQQQQQRQQQPAPPSHQGDDVTGAREGDVYRASGLAEEGRAGPARWV
ncbi:hypothetical protein RB601_007532 [Gaeumannomyces tritici]